MNPATTETINDTVSGGPILAEIADGWSRSESGQWISPSGELYAEINLTESK